MSNLKKSGVEFNEELHTYTLDGQSLMGITGIIHAMKFPDKYKDIPESILNQAAERGKAIHREMEWIDVMGIDPMTVEGRNYVNLKKLYNLNPVENEFTVTDYKRIATNIDVVFRSEGGYILGDFKTTSSLDEEYLSWQLSANAWMFEHQTGEFVTNLYGIWLRGDICTVVEIERKPDALIEQMFDDYFSGKQPELLAAKGDTLPDKYRELEQWFVDYETQKKAMEAKDKELKDGLLKAMMEAGVTSWKGERVTISLKAGYIRESVDTGSLKAKYPDIYQELIKTTKVKESIQIKVK